jgi:hypothetical protein
MGLGLSWKYSSTLYHKTLQSVARLVYNMLWNPKVQRRHENRPSDFLRQFNPVHVLPFLLHLSLPRKLFPYGRGMLIQDDKHISLNFLRLFRCMLRSAAEGIRNVHTFHPRWVSPRGNRAPRLGCVCGRRNVPRSKPLPCPVESARVILVQPASWDMNVHLIRKMRLTNNFPSF